MNRTWVPLTVTALVALVVSQLGGPMLPVDHVDEAALATATAAAGWHCLLPHRPHSSNTLRSDGRPPLAVDDLPASPGGAGTSSLPPGPPGGARADQPLPPGPPGRAGTAPAPPVAPGGAGDAAAPVAPGAAAPPGPPGRPQPIPDLGTGPGKNPRAHITGELTGSAGESFQIPLRAGEVVGVTVTGGAHRLELRDPRGNLVEGSESDRASSYPRSSPLPSGGNASLDHVAAITGTHVLTVLNGPGDYQADVSILVPPGGPAQQVYLDFTGPSVDTRVFGTDTGGAQPRKLSPLHDFLASWGLRDSDEPALTRIITDTVTANLRAAGGGAIVVTDSARSPGAWGRPDVSRVVIGGTVAESGIDTVGISESVDPGNFARQETALVLLDSLARPADQTISLNHYLTGGGDRLTFIGRAVGNIASHEAGHFLGSWHTDPDSGRHDLMAPGDLTGAFGYGPDGIGGTADDTTPRFGQDAFAPAEGFTGTEDTRNRTRVGLDGRSPAPAR